MMIFLSTLPVRGATSASIAAPRRLAISIHAPREGSDLGIAAVAVLALDFYPRSP